MYIPLSAKRLAEVLLDEPNLSREIRVRLDELLIDMRHPAAPVKNEPEKEVTSGKA